MVKWMISNELNLIFAVVYQNIFSLLHVEDLLGYMQESFRENILPQIVYTKGIYKKVPEFEPLFSACI